MRRQYGIKCLLGKLFTLTLLHSERRKLYGVLAILSAIELMMMKIGLDFMCSHGTFDTFDSDVLANTPEFQLREGIDDNSKIIFLISQRKHIL